MSFVINLSPETAYASKPNIVHPQSTRGAAGEPQVLAAEAEARTRLQAAYPQVNVSSATIKRGK